MKTSQIGTSVCNKGTTATVKQLVHQLPNYQASNSEYPGYRTDLPGPYRLDSTLLASPSLPSQKVERAEEEKRDDTVNRLKKS
ncbi:uncharacterized protein EAE98_005184 [Botrytis deweyae]|uniref:Uncharacterized protein n=1 Tax=Botrytis deweyae TaxID=2478750 RepID=A0ABQ7IN86_9HELO|nr:uncharacterized protein EAE98_005184 [Botrytis deweyae]KAF7929265.1 hypothetical protein EAE98_005184 [Botrytis deweyae]